MMGRYVGDLSIDRIRRLSDEFGFNNVEMLEKFLIDFEILGHLLVEVPSCIIEFMQNQPLARPEHDRSRHIAV